MVDRKYVRDGGTWMVLRKARVSIDIDLGGKWWRWQVVYGWSEVVRWRWCQLVVVCCSQEKKDGKG